MSTNLVEITKDLQRELGVVVDGKAGLVTLTAALAEIRAQRMESDAEKERPARVSEAIVFDARTEAVLATLDPKIIPNFRQFLCLAKGTAASLGCDYVLISGNRTWEEQDALYQQGRSKPGPIVTKARGGYSDHNFKVAADAGVFVGKTYLDGGTSAQQALAAKVHKACSLHAEASGLAWGGNWKSIVDMPHYYKETGLTTAQMRKLFLQKGSVL